MDTALPDYSRTPRLRLAPQVVFGDVIYHAGASFGPRFQGDYQLVIVLEGEATILIEGVRHHLPERHVALLKPGRREHFFFARDVETHHTWCAVHPARVAPAWAHELEAAPFCLPLSARLQGVMDLGLASPVSELPQVAALIGHLGEAALQTFVAEAALGAAAASSLPEALVRAKSQIDDHFAAPHSLESLARVACCAPGHLTRLFRQHLGFTPTRYLWRVRVERGVELLRSTGLSVAQIADRTGFATPFHFSRLVSQHYGVSPRELRARTWGQNEAPDSDEA